MNSFDVLIERWKQISFRGKYLHIEDYIFIRIILSENVIVFI